jgi:hypothetical protein
MGCHSEPPGGATDGLAHWSNEYAGSRVHIDSHTRPLVHASSIVYACSNYGCVSYVFPTHVHAGNVSHADGDAHALAGADRSISRRYAGADCNTDASAYSCT